MSTETDGGWTGDYNGGNLTSPGQSSRGFCGVFLGLLLGRFLQRNASGSNSFEG